MCRMRTEFEFVLPRGYLDPDGNVHREGVLRLATAADEIEPLEDPRVQQNRAYLVVVLLSRVMTRLGDLDADAITPEVVEGFYSADLAYLQTKYREINGLDDGGEPRRCPHCGQDL